MTALDLPRSPGKVPDHVGTARDDDHDDNNNVCDDDDYSSIGPFEMTC